MYRAVPIGPADKRHTGSGFTEVLVFQDFNLLQHFTGPMAKIRAREYIQEQAQAPSFPFCLDLQQMVSKEMMAMGLGDAIVNGGFTGDKLMEAEAV